eukprot:TRINITY_DN236_c0_g1_i1.p1 TRINITY_DN236_c0_g1~~TRINITY_DN236_c0_g1_i1.p1  ORF type:complete len:348 (-),score=94.84 TRINITY_DN236_c0_g1_i1:41-1084(-)
MEGEHLPIQSLSQIPGSIINFTDSVSNIKILGAKSTDSVEDKLFNCEVFLKWCESKNISTDYVTARDMVENNLGVIVVIMVRICRYLIDNGLNALKKSNKRQSSRRTISRNKKKPPVVVEQVQIDLGDEILQRIHKNLVDMGVVEDNENTPPAVPGRGSPPAVPGRGSPPSVPGRGPPPAVPGRGPPVHDRPVPVVPKRNGPITPSRGPPPSVPNKRDNRRAVNIIKEDMEKELAKENSRMNQELFEKKQALRAEKEKRRIETLDLGNIQLEPSLDFSKAINDINAIDEDRLVMLLEEMDEFERLYEEDEDSMDELDDIFEELQAELEQHNFSDITVADIDIDSLKI